MGYLPEMWHDFGVAVAGLAGAFRLYGVHRLDPV